MYKKRGGVGLLRIRFSFRLPTRKVIKTGNQCFHKNEYACVALRVSMNILNILDDKITGTFLKFIPVKFFYKIF